MRGGTASAVMLILIGTSILLRTVRGQLPKRIKQIVGAP